MKKHFQSITLLLAAPTMAGLVVANAAFAKEYLSGIVWEEPPTMTAPAGLGLETPPQDAFVLFGGENLDAWEGGDAWQIADGVATATKRGITTKDSFGDCQLHLEWASPDKVTGSGQGRGNSGVYLMGRYEIQILDSYDNETYFDGQCGALYKQRPPLVNVSRKPGEWQSYDIFFRAPRFDGNKLVIPGSVTVLHNGVLIQNNTTILGNTAWDSPPAYKPHPLRQPLNLQFHGNPVQFRNIWIRDLIDREDQNTASVAKRVAEVEAEAKKPAAESAEAKPQPDKPAKQPTKTEKPKTEKPKTEKPKTEKPAPKKEVAPKSETPKSVEPDKKPEKKAEAKSGN